MSHSQNPAPWSDAVAGVLNIFDQAVAQNLDAVWNPVGAKACSDVLREMARQLDEVAPEALQEQRRIIDDLLTKNSSLFDTGMKAAEHIRRMQAEREALRAAITALGGDPDDLPETTEATEVR